MAKCRVCKVVLNDENWLPSGRKNCNYICNGCERERKRRWRAAHPDKNKAISTRYTRKQGVRPFNENKECGMYLGVYIAERVLGYVFKDVKRMPMHNPGFDFICSRDKWIDVKSACLSRTKYPFWDFQIKHNTTADFFLCLAFDNREDLNPLHIWLLPGSKFNHRKTAAISPNTIHKWSEYALDISKIDECCVTMREK